MVRTSSPLTLSALLFMSALVSCEGVIFHRHTSSAGSSGNLTCVALQNHGTHSTVEVEVGTPGQSFSVVADTGSNALIVPSCICQKAGYCAMTDRCFTGTNRSSTFSVEGGPDKPTGVVLSFGSGMVKAVIAHDKVRVGNLEHQMDDGLLLMTAHALRLPGAFEGILGLGPPIPPEESVQENTSQSEEDNETMMPFNQIEKIMKGIMGGADISDIIGGMGGGDMGGGDMTGHDDFQSVLSPMSGFFNRMWNESNASNAEESSSVTGFLEQAKIEYFSMCFNDGADGVLRIGSPEGSKDTLESVGTQHWGLDFRGVSVGNVSAPLEFCQMTNLTKSQKTPCGAIPDSGTTAIMAPRDHALMLFETICDQWQRCADNYTALVHAAEAAKKAAIDNYNMDPFDISVTKSTKADVLKMLLFDCENWINESGALEELPSLKFHVVDGKGASQELEIPGVSYIMQSKMDDLEHVANESNISVKDMTTHKQVVCSPAIGEFEYETEENGPVWILGTPFFYEYIVGYNMFEKTISFTSTKDEACGACNDNNVAFVSTNRAAHQTRQPRLTSWPRRMPSIDTTKPL